MYALNRCRRAVTLLEVLISIFVLAIGLLSVASLVPVASFQAQCAAIDDRKAMLGQTAARDFKVRGFLRPDYWRTSNGTLSITNSGTGVWTSGATQTFPCYAIDPLMIAAAGTKFTGTAASTVDNFIAANSNAPAGLVMKRLTSTIAQGTAADQVCTSQDDLVYTLPTADQGNPDGLPMGAYFSGNSKRAYDGRFTWLATLVPVYGDQAAIVSRNEMLLSIVVFNQRNFGVAPQNSTSPTERAAKVTFTGTPVSISGGDLTITDANQLNVAVNVGDWLMLGAIISDPNAGSTAATADVPLVSGRHRRASNDGRTRLFAEYYGRGSRLEFEGRGGHDDGLYV